MTCKRKFSLNLSKIKRELNDSTQADHLSISIFILDLIGYHILFWSKRKNNYQRKWWIKNYNHKMLLCIVNITKIPPMSTYTVKELIVHWKAVMKSKTTKNANNVVHQSSPSAPSVLSATYLSSSPQQQVHAHREQHVHRPQHPLAFFFSFGGICLFVKERNTCSRVVWWTE